MRVVREIAINLYIKKCHVMHFGKANSNVKYHMKDSNGQQLLDESKLEKDIGLMVSYNLDVSE